MDLLSQAGGHHGLVLAIVLGMILMVRSARLGRRLPPGPRAIPLIGNLLDLPRSSEWLTYIEWGKKYDSDILHYELAGTSTIILNSRQAINDLLEKRSNIYSSRPKWTMLNEVVGWGWSFVTIPYGKTWITGRKLIHQEFISKQERYEPQTVEAVRNLLVDLLHEPDNFYNLFRHMAGAIILSITYGITIKPAKIGDPVIDMADRALRGFVAAAVPGSFLVDYLPILKYVPSWFPGASFKIKAIEWGRDADRMLNEPFDVVKKQLANGSNKPCFVSSCLDGGNTDDVDETVVRDSAGTMYLAGTDTTVCALHTFILAMVCYPEAQKLAREELDRVVGPDRLPDLQDRDNLPYITAVLFETMRWQPVNPLGLAHLVTEEDEYRGYCIPKDSVVLANAWAILRDPDIYGPDTDKFIPGRFLTLDGQINPDIPEPMVFFGTGRRMCPGRFFAMSSMYTAMAGMLHCFQIIKAKDELGNEIVPNQEFTTSSIQNCPVPFLCDIKPRSAHYENLIKTAATNLNDD